MRDLIILGTGVHAAEMAEIVARVNAAEATWNLLGFLSPKAERIGEMLNGHPILGSPESVGQEPCSCHLHYPDALFVPDNEFPRDLCPPRERMVSLIDPSAFVSRTASIGGGCVIYPHCFIGLNARLGDLVFALSGCVINHDVVIENRVVFASAVALAGHVRVEADSYLGQCCTIREHLTIGRGSMIGMGSVVVDDVPPNSVMVGNPARRLRDRR